MRALSVGLIALVTATSVAAQTDEWYLPVGNGCRLYVLELGRGSDTVVMLHGGFGAEHSYLLDAARGLEGQHHFVFYDQRGSLRSPCPDSAISLAGHIADLDRLRSALELSRMHLVGHSAGTILANSYLKAHPDRVGGLVLLGTVPPAPRTAEDSALAVASDTRFKAFEERPEIAATLQREGLDRPAEQLSAKQQTHAWRIRFAAANIYHVERWRSMQGGQVFYNARAGAAVSRTSPQPYDFVPALAAHACPVDIIAGDADLVDFGAVRLPRIAARVPTAHLDVIRNAGHNAWLDEPDQFKRLLSAALSRGAHCSR